MPPQLSRARLVAKAAKRAARQAADGLPAGDEALAALGWAPVDDSVRAVFDAADAEAAAASAAPRAGGAAARRAAKRGDAAPATAGASDWTRPAGWAAQEADPAALLTGATEFGFVSLEARRAAALAARKPPLGPPRHALAFAAR
jgi:hypothetical protein